MFLSPSIFTFEFLGLIALLCAAAAVPLWKKYGWAISLAFSLACLSSIGIWANPIPAWPLETPEWRDAFNLSAATSLVTFLVTVFATRAFSLETWIVVFRWIALLDCAGVVLGWFFHAPLFLFLNPSMDGCFLACMWPFFASNDDWFIDTGLIIIPVCICLTGQSQPIALMFIAGGMGLLLQKHYKALLLAVPLAFVLGFMITGHDLFMTSGRWQLWTRATELWIHQGKYLLGLGLGSFYLIGPELTKDYGGVRFLWMHSDWLQILFEMGSIGFVCTLGVYGIALWRSRTHVILCSSLAVFGAWGLANFPLHQPISAVLGVVLLRLALTKTHTLDPHSQE